ncbi:helix-turn-helix transcriptional regulator [Actinomycetospora sp. CA-101289]|uniref:helix-turn-helix transcriptional regulator n=1 Tax=Actinomycetospora sp. CA-101289 TaxID=3239893 RepID=UPI003D98E8B5
MEPDARAASVDLPTTQTVAAVAALGDESRRRMYEFIRGAADPVTRDQAAAAVGISRKLAAFHLDKLVEVGLLDVEVAGPGAVRRVGRRPKVYRSGKTAVRVSIPSRCPDLLVGILVEALDIDDTADDDTDPRRERVAAVARRRGRELGTSERDRTRPGRLGVERALTAVGAVLTALGFEPRRERPTELSLRNCPFHPHAAAAPQLVCGLNHALISGLLDGLQADTVAATLEPRAGECCIRLSG